MKNTTLTIVLTGILSLVLFFFGEYYNGPFIEWTIPTVQGVNYTVNSLDGQSDKIVSLGLILSLIPICTVLIWKVAPIRSPKGRLLNLLILLASVFLLGLFRYKWLIVKTNIFAAANFGNKAQINLPLENFNVTNFLFLGLMGGIAISYFASKQSIAKS